MRNFTPNDFEDSGQYILRMSSKEIQAREQNEPFNGYSNTGYLTTLIKKVGYLNGIGIGNGHERLMTLVDMSDGSTMIGNYPVKDLTMSNCKLVLWQGDSLTRKQLLCDWLNNSELCQEHRFATQEEIVRCVMYQKSRWKN
jgi:hypothetical protein